MTTRFFPGAAGCLAASALLSPLSPAAIEDLEILQRSHAELVFQYGFEGNDDASRLADLSGHGHGLRRVAGSNGGDTDDIGFPTGFRGQGQAYQPAFSTSSHQIGAGLQTSSPVELPDTVTVEAVVQLDAFQMPSGGSGGYILSARPSGKERAYFLRQLGSGENRITSTFGDNFGDAPQVGDYVPGDWYYLAVSAEYDSGSNHTTVHWYGANLSQDQASLSHLASDSTSFEGDWTGSSSVGVGSFLNGSQEFLEGRIDSVAMTSSVLTAAELQGRLDALLGGIAPEPGDDVIEVAVDGGLSFDPLANDAGSIDPASFEILSGPDHGSATFDPAEGRLVYKHDGSAPGSDLIRYRVTNVAGDLHAEAEIAVGILGDIRLAAPTVDIPLDPPAADPGEMALVDALPGLTFPHAVALAPVPGNPKALLVASVKSEIWLVPDTTVPNPSKHLLINLAARTNYVNGRSIYSIEPFPDFATTGHIVVNYQGDLTRLPSSTSAMTGLDRNGSSYNTITCDLRVSRFTLSPEHIAAAINGGLSQAENNVVLATEWPYLNLAEQSTYHTIGDVKFGPDGYLYISFGDEGEQDANYRNTQTITKDQFSSILRIDVDPASTNPKPNPHYAIAVGPLNGLESPNTPFTDPATQEPNFRVPVDNPFVGPAKGGSWNGTFNGSSVASGDLGKVRDEIWALGFRNPFKFHLEADAGSGETVAWVGDVGRYDWEEINVVRNGFNGGWAYWEGESFNPPIGYNPGAPGGITPHSLPLHAWNQNGGNGSVTGGILYHGTKLTDMSERYVFGDFNSGRIWSLSTDGAELTEFPGLRLPSERIVDFELDPATGDIFVLENNTWSGGALPKVYRITMQGGGAEDYPQDLADLGLFADLADFTPNPGVVPYRPNLKFWSDGADKRRWFAIKNLDDTVAYSPEGNWTFPEGMVWVKHFDFDLNRSLPGTEVKRLETRILVKNAEGSYGVAYQWNEDGTRATLVPTEGADFTLDYTDADGQPATLDWHIPTRSECMTCHTPGGGHALSMNTRQLNLENSIHGQTDNLLTLLSDGGYLVGFDGDPASLPRHYRPDEFDIDLEARVRSYLAVNCAYCHQAGGNAPESWDGRAHLSLEDTHMLYGSPIGEGSNPAHDIIRPGDKDSSLIWNRINAREAINGTFNGASQMPPLATNALDEEGVALLEQWIDHHANLAPSPADGSLGDATVSENALIGYLLGASTAEDPDVREGVADQSQLSYAITAGNDQGLFAIDPASGAIRLTGWIDYERQPQHVLTVEISDNFTPNPGLLTRTVIVDLIDEDSPDATEDLDGNGIFDAWETGFGLGIADPAADDDGDGLATYFEFLTGGDPTASDPPSLLGQEIVNGEGSGIDFAWNIRNGFVLGEHYQVRRSPALDGWTSLQQSVDYEIVSVTPVIEGVSRVVIRLQADQPRQFLRLGSPE